MKKKKPPTKKKAGTRRRVARRRSAPSSGPRLSGFGELLAIAAPLILTSFFPDVKRTFRTFPPSLLPPPVMPALDSIDAEYSVRSLPERLAPLKAIEAKKIDPRMPDYTTVITGWRAWAVTTWRNEWRLKSVGQDSRWPPQTQMAARCRSENAAPHPAPAWYCNCGVWAFKDLDRLTQSLAAYEPIQILGTVALWGRIIETENGYRAQYAYPSELWLLAPASPGLEEIGRIYGVPVRVAPQECTALIAYGNC